MCRGFRQARAQRRAGATIAVADFRVFVGGKVAKTDALEIALAPALLMGEIIPFAGDRAIDRTVDPVARNER